MSISPEIAEEALKNKESRDRLPRLEKVLMENGFLLGAVSIDGDRMTIQLRVVPLSPGKNMSNGTVGGIVACALRALPELEKVTPGNSKIEELVSLLGNIPALDSDGKTWVSVKDHWDKERLIAGGAHE